MVLPAPQKGLTNCDILVVPAADLGLKREGFGRFEHTIDGHALPAYLGSPPFSVHHLAEFGAHDDVNATEIGEGEISAIGHVHEHILIGDPDRESQSSRRG